MANKKSANAPSEQDPKQQKKKPTTLLTKAESKMQSSIDGAFDSISNVSPSGSPKFRKRSRSNPGEYPGDIPPTKKTKDASSGPNERAKSCEQSEKFVEVPKQSCVSRDQSEVLPMTASEPQEHSEPMKKIETSDGWAPSPPDEQANADDRRNWGGWCEIESEAIWFTAMIQEMGVKELRFAEVHAIDADSLKTELSQPIYGIVLLLRARDIDADLEAEECPENVWFANQMPHENSCASLALMNTLMNIENVDLGDPLQQFKDFSHTLTPFQRGEALSNFLFVKQIHNSFAKKMDMLEEDLKLSRRARKGTKERRLSKDTNVSDDSDRSFEDNAHHFIAFVPIDGEVWKLDGMDANPTSIGEFSEAKGATWLEITSDRIMDLMNTAGDADYACFALVPADVPKFSKQMCTSIATYEAVKSRLDVLSSDWNTFVVSNGLYPISPGLLSNLGVGKSFLDNASVPPAVQTRIATEEMEALLVRREGLIQEQNDLQESLFEAFEQKTEDEDALAARRWDYGPVIKTWLEMLAKNGFLEKNLQLFEEHKKKAATQKASKKK